MLGRGLLSVAYVYQRVSSPKEVIETSDVVVPAKIIRKFKRLWLITAIQK